MKVREYLVENVQDSFLFCPSCHKRVLLPFKGNVKVQSSMNINCGYCKGGQVKVKVKKEEEVIENG